MYLMTDFVLFASLFAVYAVLRGNTFGGPAGSQIFNLQFVLIETLILLTSSFICGLAFLAAQANKKILVLSSLTVTFILGVAFVFLEVSEFSKLIIAGNGPSRSGFLSAYFALVGTHGLHVALGLVWLSVLMLFIAKRGLTDANMRKLQLWSLFWHFLDVVWIFIFTIVYLIGMLT